ncbi:MAG: hypothetical protein ACR2G4_14635 [Pyrinomonadaceae bacterium]
MLAVSERITRRTIWTTLRKVAALSLGVLTATRSPGVASEGGGDGAVVSGCVCAASGRFFSGSVIFFWKVGAVFSQLTWKILRLELPVIFHARRPCVKRKINYLRSVRPVAAAIFFQVTGADGIAGDMLR